jgi:hypothetical protein
MSYRPINIGLPHQQTDKCEDLVYINEIKTHAAVPYLFNFTHLPGGSLAFTSAQQRFY